MEEYKVVSITDKEGNPRSDGRYPLRIGRICEKPDPHQDLPLIIGYKRNADGSDYSNRHLRTSRVIDWELDGDSFVIETMNSVYTIEKCE